ncbi:MAG: hypothetical protein ACKVY0_30735 [Prosthecobacter sp.]|uniref:hypothetical protein n=1 Tax=Prosthecobacter sp. TaxID=1965333 RepID=UPI0038FE4A89
MTSDDLQRYASLLRWVGLGVTVFGILLTGASHYVADKLLVVNKSEKIKSQERLKASEIELSETKAKASEIEARLKKITTPRVLTSEQIKGLKEFLQAAPKGKVTMTFLSVEPDAQKYSEQIGLVLRESGFDVVAPQKLWLQLAFDDLFIGVRSLKDAPPYVVAIQKAFQSIGLKAPAHEDPNLFTSFSPILPDDCHCIVCISNKPK